MAFVSSGYNPEKPMEGRISDIGPRKYDSFFPEVIKKNFGKWLYHEILEPGVLVHVARIRRKVYTRALWRHPYDVRYQHPRNLRNRRPSTAMDTFAGRPVTTSNSW